MWTRAYGRTQENQTCTWTTWRSVQTWAKSQWAEDRHSTAGRTPPVVRKPIYLHMITVLALITEKSGEPRWMVGRSVSPERVRLQTHQHFYRCDVLPCQRSNPKEYHGVWKTSHSITRVLCACCRASGYRLQLHNFVDALQEGGKKLLLSGPVDSSMLRPKLRGLSESADMKPLTSAKSATTTHRSHNLSRLVGPSWSAEAPSAGQICLKRRWTQTWRRCRLTCSVPQVPPSSPHFFRTLQKHFQTSTRSRLTNSLGGDGAREPGDRRNRTRRIRRHLGVCASETPLQRRGTPGWQAPRTTSQHVVPDRVGAPVGIADTSLATQPEQVEGEKTVKLKAAQLTSFLLHPAWPSLLLSLTVVLEPTTARPKAWKFDVGELLDINSHDTPLVYRWVVRTSPRKYVTGVDKVGRLERRLLPAQQRHYSPTCWPEVTLRHSANDNYDRAPKKRHLDWNIAA